MNWLSRMFTIPRKKREELNANPIVHLLGGLVQSAAIASAQGVVDQHISDPVLAEKIKAAIESEVKAHVPIPETPAPSVADLLGLRPMLPVPAIDPVAAGAENAGG